jgi:hypothetical protein
MLGHRLIRMGRSVGPGLFLSVLAGLAAPATSWAGSETSPVSAVVSQPDVDAASTTTNHHLHVLRNRGSSLTASGLSFPAKAQRATGLGGNVSGAYFYPGDVSDNGGEIVTSAVSHAVYVNCPSGPRVCWGSPETFLTDLGQSSFIHLVDQYVGSTASNRYTNGQSFSISYTSPTSGSLRLTNLLSIVHSAVLKNNKQAGYGHIYHVFLPKGTDVCVSGLGCYSPDSPKDFTFCAFHSSVDFATLGHVLFTVEPYQGVAGCQQEAAASGFPNGALADSTYSTLSHELFETITDPDGTSWYVVNDLDLYGAEIGDTCQTPTGLGSILPLGGGQYEIQLEYSDATHACSSSN